MIRSPEELPADLENTTLPSQLDDSSTFVCDSRPMPSSLSSPGKQSPGRPKTMKEYEEESEELKRENFHLKVRIYFMEQNRFDPSVPKDVDELRNAFTDLKVDYELQKKDLAKKEDLILHSYRAMDALKQQVETSKAEREEDQRQISELSAKIHAMEKELKEYQLKFMETSVDLDDTNAMYALTFGLKNSESKQPNMVGAKENLVKDLESNLSKERARVVMLEDEIASLNERSAKDQEQIKAMGDKLIRLTKEFETAVNKNKELEKVGRFEKESHSQYEALETCIDDLKITLDNKQSKIESMKAYIKNLEKEFDLVKIKLNEKEDKLSEQRRANEQLVLDLRKEKKHLKQLSAELELAARSPRSPGRRGLDHDLNQKLRAQLEELQHENRELRKSSTRPDHFTLLLQDCFKQIKRLEKENEALKVASHRTDRDEINNKQANDSMRSSTSEKDSFIIELLNRIEELTGTLNSRELKLEELRSKMDLSSNKVELEKSKTESDIRALEEKHEKDMLAKDLADKQKEVDALKRELKKKTYNLQGLVNTELWNKNREIEKLNKAFDLKQMEVLTLQKQLKEYELNSFHEKGLMSPILLHQSGRFSEDKENLQPVTDTVLQVQILNEEKRALTRKVEELEARLQNLPERDADSQLACSLRAERDRAERLRREAVQACVLLTTRLRELADFLDSLLPALGGRRRKAVMHAVERSRELSRSLSLAAEESSMLQYSTWTDLQPSLCVSLLPDISTVDFWSGDEDEAVDRGGRDDGSRIGSTLDATAARSEFTFDEKLLETTFPEYLVDAADSDRNAADQSARVSPKSANIGKITLTSRKKTSVSAQIAANVGEAKQRPDEGASDYETWSEPDRDVSLARMGLKESPASAGKTPQPHEATTETADSAQRSPTRRASETQRLQRKLQSLEQVNEALRTELAILHQLAPVDSAGGRQDKATSIEINRQSGFSVPTHLLEEIRNQREKLEASLFHNDYIRRQLETALKKNQGGEEMKTPVFQLKEVAKQLEEAETQISLLKSEKDEYNRKIEMMETTIQQTSNELIEKQCALLSLENQTAQRIKDLEGNFKEAYSHLEHKYLEKENEWLRLEKERDQLLEKISENDQHISKLTGEVEKLQKENKKCKKLHEELNVKIQQISNQKDDLQRVVGEQEQLMADAERERLELATQLIARDRQVEQAESAGRELEAALRAQLEAATAQCSHFEARLREVDVAAKQLALLKNELERRVSELELVNSELETRLASLNVKQVYSDCDTDGASVAGSPTRRLPLPLTLPLPLSPPPFSRPRYSSQRSQDLTSDYLSEPDNGLGSPQGGLPPCLPGWIPSSPHSQPSASPDLGIESDHGRFSSLDSVANKTSALALGAPGTDLVKLEEENTQLRRNLTKTRRALEETLSQLTAANQHKRQYEAQLSAVTQHKAKVERAICRQINKTHSILKKAKVNLEQDQH